MIRPIHDAPYWDVVIILSFRLLYFILSPELELEKHKDQKDPSLLSCRTTPKQHRRFQSVVFKGAAWLVRSGTRLHVGLTSVQQAKEITEQPMVCYSNLFICPKVIKIHEKKEAITSS